MPDRSEKMICLGVLTRPHGIKGEFCLNLYADSPTLLSGPITLKKPDGTEKPCTAEGFRPHKNAWLVTIRGVNDRTQAEALAGSTLWLPRHCLPSMKTRPTSQICSVGLSPSRMARFWEHSTISKRLGDRCSGPSAARTANFFSRPGLNSSVHWGHPLSSIRRKDWSKPAPRLSAPS